MEQIISILTEIHPGVDYAAAEGLMSGGVLDSLDVVAIIGELSGAFDIQIPVEEIKPENFDSAGAMLEMVRRIQAEG